jgi:hypothetical protein
MTIASLSRVAAVLSFSLMAAGTAHAVYRCGNVYQDRPCDEKGPQAHLTPGMKAAPAAGAGPTAATAASPYAATCARAGEDAQKVVWKREAGATQERQLAELPNTGSRAAMAGIIDSVYRKRGSAPEIRAAVEAECVAEKQKEADEAAALKLLLQRQAAGAAPAPAAAQAPTDSPATHKAQASTGPSPSCPGWRSSLESVKSEMRVGGSAAAMEDLQNRRRAIDKKLLDGRC